MKIVVIRPRGVIAPHVVHGYCNGFTALGHQVLQLELENGFKKQGLELVREFGPDFVFCYGLTGFIPTGNADGQKGGLFRMLGIPLVMAHYDNPFFILTGEIVKELQNYPKYYYSFIWDEYLLELFTRSGLPNGYSTLLATDPELFYPQGIPPEPQTLSFVGRINLDKMGLDGLQPLVKKFAETVIETKIDRFEVPLLDICLQALELSSYSEIKQLFINDPVGFWTNVYCQILHVQGSNRYRYAILNCIEETPIHLYGTNNWEKSNIILHDNVPYGKELAAVYQKYAVNLNLSSFQLETSVNNRVFDVFASGGFVLSDYKREMEKVFPDHWQEITFRNLEELGNKGEYYLSHPKQRDELIAELYQHVTKYHTYKNRVEEIIDVMIRNLEISKDGIEGTKIMNQESPKKQEYRGAFNAGLLDLIPSGVGKFLEVGCADGLFGEYLLKEGLAHEVVGLEINPGTAAIAAGRLSKVHCGNAEELKLPYSDEYFDCLIYGDVLEHLREPGKLLEEHLRYLKPGGYVVCSIPNIRNLFIILHLLSGNWTYASWGILDKTHLRFFTRKEIIKMISGLGLSIEIIAPSLRGGEWYTKMYGPEYVTEDFIKLYNELLQLRLKNEDISGQLKTLFPAVDFSQDESIELFAAQMLVKARKA